jgi:integrase
LARKTAKALPRLLRLKGQTFWFARDLPVDCRKIFGKKTWLTNLGTADIKVATERRNALEAETTLAFTAMRTGTWNPSEGLSPAARGELYRETLSALTRVPDADPEALELAVFAAESERDTYRGSQKLAFGDALEGSVEVDRHIDAYLATIAKLAPATVRGRKGHILQFARWAAEKKLRLDAINRRVAGQYVTMVIDPMHPKTATAHLGSLRAYWSFMHRRGHIVGADAKGGPWADQQTEVQGKRVERGNKDEARPFTADEVRTLLYSTFPPRMSAACEAQLIDALTISLLSGMRQEEIATLWVEEVHDGVFDIQQGKTPSAARQVPIHPSLLEIIKRRTEGKGPKDWLFHELANERDAGDVLGKRFRRYRVALGVNDKREGKRRSLVTFHSARHWFAYNASIAGQHENTIGSVIGHQPDKKKTTFGIYIKGTSEEQRKACVEAVQLPSRI